MITSFLAKGRRGAAWLLACLAGGGAALGAAGVAAVPAHASQAAHASSAAPRCGIAHPAEPGGAFVWASSIANGFAGGYGLEAEISNVGLHPCTLRGVPGVAAVDSNGHIVGTRVPGSPNGPLITLQPRATAHVGLTVHQALTICAHPVSAKVVLYLSGHKTGQDTFLTVQACPGN
jgi:hypothetical protein